MKQRYVRVFGGNTEFCTGSLSRQLYGRSPEVTLSKTGVRTLCPRYEMDEIDEFTWIVPDRLLACRYPMDREALERLRALGVCGLVNLTELRHDQTILAELEI